MLPRRERPAELSRGASNGSNVSQPSESDGRSWGFSGWQNDQTVEACPSCGTAFTLTFRRHHCKSCGCLACSNCSPHWLRLPKHPEWGKVRVCNTCALDIRDDHAMGVQEDLAQNTEINNTIKAALKKVHEECEEYKCLLLQLDAEANGSELLERHAKDPNAPEFSFEKLQEKAKKTWAEQQEKLRDQIAEKARLQQRCQSMKEKLQHIEGQDSELRAREEDLERQLRELKEDSAEIEKLRWKHRELDLAIAQMRQQVQSLEAERARVNPEADGEGAHGRCCCRPQEDATPTGAAGQSILVVSTGRLDLSEAPPSRTEGCRRTCQIM